MSDSDTFFIRLQFPNGRSELIPVTASTTVQELHDQHVAAHVPEGLRGQLIYMGRPLAPPLSTMASHGVTNDTVVQIFIRRPMPAGANGDPDGPAAPHAGAPVNSDFLAAIIGFFLSCAWLYMFMDLQELEEDWGDTHILSVICLLFLSVIFVAAGGVRHLTGLFRR